ncbi:transmembrane protein 176 [Lepisosteus oculatus]|uniref:Membrane spanning 4-domains A12 n=1 Tax=Lepisosteus oculatus TaxID=7918 RepID=W5MNH9_LEPOC|nr:PREDICTED: membrane-spanning 4-domains subfamily A member 12 [Lepisosteus oculatus]
MAVSISRDLSVTLTDSSNDKLADRQWLVKESIARGEPKALGVSEVMVGVLVICFAAPLMAGDVTEVLNFGVPWWSGVMFIVSGAVAIVTEKHTTLLAVQVCLAATALAAVVSLVAVIIYFVDLFSNPETGCTSDSEETGDCNGHQQFATAFSRGVKSSLLVFTVVQTVISFFLSIFLFREKKKFTPYTALNLSAPPTPTTTGFPVMN